MRLIEMPFNWYEMNFINAMKFMPHPDIRHQQDLPFGFMARPTYSLSEVERLIKKHRFIVPCPSRCTLIKMCEDGTFETPASRRSLWLVYEDSFWKWAERYTMAIAA